MKSTISTVSREVQQILEHIDEEEAHQLAQRLGNNKRIFVAGEGRSGLVGKAFAMRLMHGGFTVYVIGETITPSIEAGDLLVAISGSGSTKSIMQYADVAKGVGATVVAVTTDRASTLANLSDGLLVIPAATKKRRAHEPETIQPLGNQFDQSLHLLLDAVAIEAFQDKQADNQAMTTRHANLE
ncbi:6-phospho-3-hexuloisomerase [Pontibacillus salicampi]|uniref:6-phospho-3-hexuloisomerase n=1 Tax=Pontibacillus salicampi TaxID=1449801 RepID=A0ABV6LQI6_9BACI